jgi:hypothetical protein
MLKRLLYITLFTLFTWALFAQDKPAVLDQKEITSVYWVNTVPFYNIPGAKIGEYYEHKIEFRVPKDTISSIGGKIMKVAIKELEIIDVENIPEGLLHSQSVINNSDEDFFRIILDIYGRLESFPKNSINIDLSVTLSVNNGKSVIRTNRIENILMKKVSQSEKLETYMGDIGLKGLRYYPDPMTNKTDVNFWSSKLQLVEFEIRDAIGNLKFKKTFTANVGSNTISFSQDELPDGLYLYSVRTENQILAKRLIVN